MKAVRSDPDIASMKPFPSRSLTPQPLKKQRDMGNIRQCFTQMVPEQNFRAKSFEVINCRFRSSGCYVRLPRERMDLHLRNNAATHSLLLLGRLDAQEREKRKLSARIVALEKSIFAITEFLANLEQEEPPQFNRSSGERKGQVKTESKPKVSLKEIIRNLHQELARAKMTPDVKPLDTVFAGPRVLLNSHRQNGHDSSMLHHSKLDQPVSHAIRSLRSRSTETESKTSSGTNTTSSDSDDVQVEIQIHNPNSAASAAEREARVPVSSNSAFTWARRLNGNIHYEREDEENEDDQRSNEDLARERDDREDRGHPRTMRRMMQDGRHDHDDEEDEEDDDENDEVVGSRMRRNSSPEERDITAETLAQMSEICAKLSPNERSPVSSSRSSSISSSSQRGGGSLSHNNHNNMRPLPAVKTSLRIRQRNAKRKRRASALAMETEGSYSATSITQSSPSQQGGHGSDSRRSSSRASSNQRSTRPRRERAGSNSSSFATSLSSRAASKKRSSRLGIDKESFRQQTQMAARRVQQLMDEEGKIVSRKKKSRNRSLKQKFGLQAFEAPKKPKTAYNYYQIGVRESILKELLLESGGSLGSKEVQSQKIARVIGERWKAMPEHERQIFNNLAAKDKERYKRDLDDYVKLNKQLEQSKKQLSSKSNSKDSNVLPGA
mmetsp:Transcript_28651/g.48650  ORF Transcript_28651/g.48650 Transcript_28651/m.48650 type:complete len:666 (+) Transcript_28651:117-2114(+)